MSEIMNYMMKLLKDSDDGMTTQELEYMYEKESFMINDEDLN